MNMLSHTVTVFVNVFILISEYIAYGYRNYS